MPTGGRATEKTTVTRNGRDRTCNGTRVTAPRFDFSCRALSEFNATTVIQRLPLSDLLKGEGSANSGSVELLKRDEKHDESGVAKGSTRQH